MVRKHVVVLVLGDFGRSPRMQYHSLSLANIDSYAVDVVGYPGTNPVDAIRDNPHIQQHLISPVSWKFPRILFPLYLVAKVIYQVMQLMWVLLIKLPHPEAILVQNPPAIPTLLVAHLVCVLRCCRLIIDWHNFGYTILGLSIGKGNILVKLAYWFERWFGRGAHANFCVTAAMQTELKVNWGIEATVLYDQPPEFFRRLNIEERHKLFCKLQNERILVKDSQWKMSEEEIKPGDNAKKCEKTIFSYIEKDQERTDIVHLREDRPALVVSSTSWSEDEDFSILLDALKIVEKDLRSKTKVVLPVGALVILNGLNLTNHKHNGKKATICSQYDADKDRYGVQLTDGSKFFIRSTFVKKCMNDDKKKKILPQRILVMITGKGPLRSYYESKIRETDFRHIKIQTAWLEAGDYPKLLGCADLGVSLHMSSSGLDLPMKVVDMFGATLPVLALKFSCLHELIEHGKNGIMFSNANELANNLMELLSDFPNKTSKLNSMRKVIQTRHNRSDKRWDYGWKKSAFPAFRNDSVSPQCSQFIIGLPFMSAMFLIALAIMFILKLVIILL